MGIFPAEHVDFSCDVIRQRFRVRFHVVFSREFGLARYGALYTVIIATFVGAMGGGPQSLALLCGSSLRKALTKAP